MACALPPHAPPVPAAIVVRTTGCYAKVLPSGRAVRWHPPKWPGVARAGEGVWVRHTRGRLTLVRGGRVFWRSKRFRGSDAVFVHGQTIAYAVYPRRYESSEEVWFARVGGGERRVARHEDPIGWTRAHLLLLWKGPELIARDVTGRRVRTLHIRQALFGPNGHTLLALLNDGRLVRTDGATTTTLTRIRNRHYALSDVLPGGLIVLQRVGAMRILDGHGRRYAFTRIARRDNVGGSVTRLPDGSLAFSVVATHEDDAIDSVLMLRRGTQSAERLYARRLPLSCGHWTTLDYRAGRLLYSSQGRVALIDPTRRRRTVDLTRLTRGSADAWAAWAAELP